MFALEYYTYYICSVMNGKELKILRKKNKLTQKELAKEINVFQGVVSGWENDKHKISNAYLTILENFFKK